MKIFLVDEKIYSVRMRAAQNGSHENGGRHISGGEHLATYSNLNDVVNSLMEKVLSHSRGNPDFIQIQCEVIDEPIEKLKPLHVETNNVHSVEEGHNVARNLLKKAGVPTESIEKAYEIITECSELRGAILFDIRTNSRIDQRNEKGIRVSRMDWLTTNFKQWANFHDISPSPRVREALVLATKVSNHPNTVAELCWSDDPEYITGYVASNELGYQRITKLKEHGDDFGCRVFFVNDLQDVSSYINFLEKQPILVQWGEDE